MRPPQALRLYATPRLMIHATSKCTVRHGQLFTLLHSLTPLLLLRHPAGSLAIPLALRGAAVSASDISAAMAGEAQKRYEAAVAAGAAAPATPPKFEAMDLE